MFIEIAEFVGSGSFLWGPNEPNLSNETIVLAPIDAVAFPKGLPPGTVLAKITAAGATLGQYGPHDPAAADGRQLNNALALLYHHAAPNVAAQKNVGVVRHQVVNGNLLVLATAHDAAQKAAVEAGLAAQQIMARH